MTTSEASDPTTTFRAARDLLLDLRSDYATARTEYRPPRPEQFNWALDWFDQVAADGADPQPAGPAGRRGRTAPRSR